MSVDFIYYDSNSVSINVIYHSSHTSQNNQKINQKQSKYLVSTLIKMSLTLYTAEFYSSADQLQLKVKRVADWVKCNTIHSKIDQNSRAYFKVIWLWSFIQYIMYWIKHMISSWCLFVWDIFWIWNFVNVDLTDLLALVLESVFIVDDYFWSIN